jgi:hypothetical protein
MCLALAEPIKDARGLGFSCGIEHLVPKPKDWLTIALPEPNDQGSSDPEIPPFSMAKSSFQPASIPAGTTFILKNTGK